MRLWIGLGILGAALIALIVAGGDGPVAGVESDQFGRMAYISALLVLMTAGIWHRFRDRMGESLRNLLIWIGIGAVIIAGYVYREQAKDLGGSMLGALRPGTAIVGPGGEVTITRRADGDFSVFAEVNGRSEQRFAFDTGASSVVLTLESAATLGIKPADGEFTQKVSTANGTAMTAPIRLDSITIGPITEKNVDAMVSQAGALRTNLLGQSFLTRLPSYEVRGDRLILRSR